MPPASLLQQRHERLKVAGFSEDIHAAVAAVQDVVDTAVNGIACTPGHGGRLAGAAPAVNKVGCPPFFLRAKTASDAS